MDHIPDLLRAKMVELPSLAAFSPNGASRLRKIRCDHARPPLWRMHDGKAYVVLRNAQQAKPPKGLLRVLPGALPTRPDRAAGVAACRPAYSGSLPVRTRHCSSTSAPAAQSFQDVFSISAWLRPPSLGTKIMAPGTTWAM